MSVPPSVHGHDQQCPAIGHMTALTRVHASALLNPPVPAHGGLCALSPSRREAPAREWSTLHHRPAWRPHQRPTRGHAAVRGPGRQRSRGPVQQGGHGSGERGGTHRPCRCDGAAAAAATAAAAAAATAAPACCCSPDSRLICRCQYASWHGLLWLAGQEMSSHEPSLSHAFPPSFWLCDLLLLRVRAVGAAKNVTLELLTKPAAEASLC